MGQDSFSNILPSPAKKVGKVATNLATFGAPTVLGETAKLAGAKDLGNTIQNGFGLFSEPAQPAPVVGLTGEEEKALRNAARQGSFGIANSGALGGRSREQVERELFNASIEDALTKKQNAIVSQQEQELMAEQKVAQITASRNAASTFRANTPGARIQTIRSRGFLA